MATLMKASVISSLLAAGLAAQAPAQDKLTFPIEWQIGKTYVQNSSMEQKMNMMGQGEMVMKLAMELTAVPKEGPEPGTTDVTMTYTGMEMTAQMGGQELPGVAAASEKLVGKNMIVRFDDKGEVIDVDAAGLQLGDDPMAAQMLNPANLKQMASQGSLLAQPEQPVAPGETWKFRREQPNPALNLVLEGTYTFEKLEEIDGAQTARLAFEGTISGGVDEEAGGEEADAQREMMKAMGLKISEGKVSGVSNYDLALKNVIRSEMQMDMTMNMKNPATGEAMDMPVRTRLTQTLKATDTE
jgi:hypothetical protein